MSSGKLIVVVGLTATQGGSVVNTFLFEPGWRIHAPTRNTPSTDTQNLASSGVEVVCANIDDPLTLTPAFDGLELGKAPSLGIQRLLPLL